MSGFGGYGKDHASGRRFDAGTAQNTDACGPICQKCKREHPRINLARLTHDATDVESVTLFCPSCHAKYDARQRHAMTRRTLARRRGQLWFNAALEYAPFAIWEIPEAVRDAAIQQPLFPVL